MRKYLPIWLHSRFEVAAMSQVKIDSHIWDLICEHYAGIHDPGLQDQQVIAYMEGKLKRQMLHDAYMTQKRVSDLLDETTRT